MAEPKHQMLKFTESLSLPEALTKNAVIPFLDEKSLYALTWSCKHYRKEYKDKHEKVAADKKVANEMLHCVLNPTLPNQARFLELLSVPKQDLKGPPLYLIRNIGEEVYFNEAGTKKTKTKRQNTNVLEAILRTKNFHLAKSLFNCIPKYEKTDSLKKLIKEINAHKIWGMPDLQLVYKNFIDSWETLVKAENWTELDKLWGRIGQAIKEHLPWFSIYLFCHPVKHSEADYTKAPNWTCILWDNTQLDFDFFGPDSIYSLYKGAGTRVDARRRPASAPGGSLDSAAFSSQCEVLRLEMDKTIKLYDLDDPTPDSSTKPAFG